MYVEDLRLIMGIRSRRVFEVREDAERKGRRNRAEAAQKVQASQESSCKRRGWVGVAKITSQALDVSNMCLDYAIILCSIFDMLYI